MSSLDTLNLSTDEEVIYRLLLVSGQLSSGELQFASNKSLESVNSVLSSLAQKKLIRRISGIESRYACLLPVGSLKDELIQAANEVNEKTLTLEGTSQQTISGLKASLEEQTAKFENSVDAASSAAKEKISASSEASTAKLSEINSAADSQINALSTSYDEFQSQVETQGIEKTQATVLSAKASIQQHLSGIISTIGQTQAAQDSLKAEATPPATEPDFASLTDAHGSLLTTITTVQNKQNEVLDKLKDNLSGIQRRLSTQFDEQLVELSDIEASVLSVLSGSLSELKFLNSQLKEQVSGYVTSLKAEEKGLEDHTNQTMNSLQSAVDGHLSSISSLLTNVQAKMEEMQVSFGSEYSTKIGSFHTELSGSIDSLDVLVTNKVLDMKQQLSSTLKNETATIQTKLSKLFEIVMEETTTQFTTLHTEFDGKLQTIEQELSTKLQQDKSEMKEKLDQSKNDLQASLDAFNQATSEHIKTSITAEEGSLSEKKSSLKASTDEQLAALTQTITDLQASLASVESAIESGYTETDTKLSETLTAQQSQLQGQFSQRLAALREQLETQNKEHEETLDRSYQDVQQLITTNKTEAESKAASALQSYQQALQTEYETVRKILQSQVDAVHQKYIEALTQIKQMEEQSTSTLSGQMTSLEQDVATTYSSALEQLTIAFSTLQSSIQTATKDMQDSMQQQISTMLSSISAEVTEVFTSLRSTGSSGTEAQIQAVQSAFSGFIANYKTSASGIADKANSLAQVLDNIFSMQEGSQTPELTTTHIVGTEANVAQVTEIIKRIKSKATLLLPSVDMVDNDAIIALPRTAQITLISYIDEFEHKDWIEKMHNVNANVTLRSLTKSGIGSALPDFIGCEREGEEILLATRDEKADTFIGITSLSEDFVKILGNIVIADYARGRSKQIARN